MLHKIKGFILNPDFSLFKEVMLLAFPVILSNISRVFMHITDTAMVGHLGKNSLVAVAMSGMLIWIAISVGIGFRILATGGTAKAFSDVGISVGRVNKVKEGRPHIVDIMRSGEVHLVFSTSDGAVDIADSKSLRATAVNNRIPYYTTVAGARATVLAILAMHADTLEVAPLQSYFE